MVLLMWINCCRMHKGDRVCLRCDNCHYILLLNMASVDCGMYGREDVVWAALSLQYYVAILCCEVRILWRKCCVVGKLSKDVYSDGNLVHGVPT